MQKGCMQMSLAMRERKHAVHSQGVAEGLFQTDSLFRKNSRAKEAVRQLDLMHVTLSKDGF